MNSTNQPTPAQPTSSNETAWIAHFVPQAWQRDYAIEVDPEGEQSWDCTATVAENAAYVATMVARNGGSRVDVLDHDDVFKADPAAPEWVREWSGPFDIHLTETRR